MTDVNEGASGVSLDADPKTLKVADLQRLAAALGVAGASKLRKGELVEAIQTIQNSTDTAAATTETSDVIESVSALEVAPEAPVQSKLPELDLALDQAFGAEKAAPPARRKSRRATTATVAPNAAPIVGAPVVEAPAVQEPVAQAPAATAPAEPAAPAESDGSQLSAPVEADAAESRDDRSAGTSESTDADEATPEQTPRRSRGNRRGRGRDRDRNTDDAEQGAAEQGGGEQNRAAQNAPEQDAVDDDAAGTDADESQNQDAEQQDGQSSGGRRGRGRGRNQNNGGQNNGGQNNGGQNAGNQNADAGQKAEAKQEQPGQNRGNQGNQGAQGDDAEGRGGRSRYRDRKRRGSVQNDDVEPEISEDDVLIPVAGILDVLDNYAFVRTSGYLPGTNDVYVSLGQVKKYHLRKGDAVVGAIRQPRDNDSSSRQKYNAIVKVDSVNGLSVDEAGTRVEFGKLTPLYPQERLRLETEQNKLTQRIIDLVAPIGKGQRGLIVAPPKAGKTIVLQQIANAISINNPEVHLMVVLVDERPEEVTDMQRTVKGEVIASTFDRPAEDHTTVAELAIERAKRLVELGHDVVVLLDSITRLGRAYNLAAPASGRILSGGVDAAALYPPKRFFGAARNIENGGSLTILATALVETGSKMDEVIFEEFKGTGNSELRLSRQLADKRIFPAVDVNASSTRREEMLLAPDEVKVTWKLRRALAGLDQQQALEVVLGKLKETTSNVEFLVQMQKSMPAPTSHSHGHENNHR
ncbi:transcription termination factor Rho [Plantibacter sp. ME-Dv--P-095]|uniref:transcription termination factor Rho n=1 Tax=Plantibacter sp. ME-Dv--P-095 TaxID=3040299 RepID=UPI00254F5162|nr:transcription termination factor Rho [Plantibacter sp. ME-Dv--P-095]